MISIQPYIIIYICSLKQTLFYTFLTVNQVNSETYTLYYPFFLF